MRLDKVIWKVKQVLEICQTIREIRRVKIIRSIMAKDMFLLKTIFHIKKITDTINCIRAEDKHQTVQLTSNKNIRITLKK